MGASRTGGEPAEAWAVLRLPGEPGDGPIACSVDELEPQNPKSEDQLLPLSKEKH